MGNLMLGNGASEPLRGSALYVTMSPLPKPRYDKPNAHVWCINRILELVEEIAVEELPSSMDELTEFVCSKLDRTALSKILALDNLHPKQGSLVREGLLSEDLATSKRAVIKSLYASPERGTPRLA